MLDFRTTDVCVCRKLSKSKEKIIFTYLVNTQFLRNFMVAEPGSTLLYCVCKLKRDEIMSLIEFDTTIDTIRDLEDTIACLESELETFLSEGRIADSDDVYRELLRAKRELANLLDMWGLRHE